MYTPLPLSSSLFLLSTLAFTSHEQSTSIPDDRLAKSLISSRATAVGRAGGWAGVAGLWVCSPRAMCAC
jgi:hypothetical protein